MTAPKAAGVASDAGDRQAVDIRDRQTVDTRFGRLAGRAHDVVTLVEGLPGFETCRRFVLLSSPDLAPLMCLQGIDDTTPSFLVIDPRLADPDYPCRLDDLQRRRLGVSSGDSVLWLAIVCVRDGEDARVNLRAPLVVNPARMRGMQLLSGFDDYDTNQRLG